MSKKDDILEAALLLFAQRGYHGTSVPDLAKAAGVGAGTIYRHFDSKEGVVNALYRLWKERFRQQVFAAQPTDGSWRQRFRTLWQAMFQFARDHPQAIQFLDLHHHSDYLDDESRAVELSSAASWLEVVLAGQREEALVDTDPATLIAMSYGAFLGLMRAEASGYFPLTDDNIAQAEERVWALMRR